MAYKKRKKNPVQEQEQNPTQALQFRDPDEQWIDLGKLELEKEHILPIIRGGLTLPNDRNTLIYPGRRGTNHRTEQVAIKWLDDEPENTAALNRGNMQYGNYAPT